jgi:hypothetical protein
MPTTDEILDSIDNRLRELRGEMETLSAARAALHHDAPPRAPRRVAILASDGLDTGSEPTDTSRKPRRGGGPHSTARLRAPGRTGRPKGRANTRRAVNAVTARTLELLLTGTSGLATSELAHRANGDHEQVLVLLRELEIGGRVRRTGERRGTRWHAITDEDRVSQRAAELIARSTRGA